MRVYIGHTNYCPLRYNNIGYWKPKVSGVTEYRSSKNGQYSTGTGPWLRLGPMMVEYWPLFVVPVIRYINSKTFPILVLYV